MLPREIKQVVKYNGLLIPSEHRHKSQQMGMDIWIDIMRINSGYPKEEILVEHLLKDFGDGMYTLDMRLSCRNAEVQKKLNDAYEQHMYWPRFERPKELRDDDFAEYGSI